MLLGVTAGAILSRVCGGASGNLTGKLITVGCFIAFVAIRFKATLVTKNNTINPMVTLSKNDPDPRLPNTVCEAPLPNDAPIVAPFPCCTNTSAMTHTAASTCIIKIYTSANQGLSQAKCLGPC